MAPSSRGSGNKLLSASCQLRTVFAALLIAASRDRKLHRKQQVWWNIHLAHLFSLNFCSHTKMANYPNASNSAQVPHSRPFQPEQSRPSRPLSISFNFCQKSVPRSGGALAFGANCRRPSMRLERRLMLAGKWTRSNYKLRAGEFPILNGHQISANAHAEGEAIKQQIKLANSRGSFLAAHVRVQRSI